MNHLGHVQEFVDNLQFCNESFRLGKLNKIPYIVDSFSNPITKVW